MANVGFKITEIRDKIEDCCNQAGQSVEQAPRYKNVLCSTQLRKKFILLTNVKILTFISGIID